MTNLEAKTEILELTHPLGDVWQRIYDSVTQLESELHVSRHEIEQLKYLIKNPPLTYNH